MESKRTDIVGAAPRMRTLREKVTTEIMWALHSEMSRTTPFLTGTILQAAYRDAHTEG